MRSAGQEISLHRGAMPQASSVSLAEHLLGRLTSPSMAVVRAETQIRVQDALNAMDPTDREVLALRHFELLSNGEVAQVLGLSKAAASNRYVRALKRMKDVLSALPAPRLAASGRRTIAGATGRETNMIDDSAERNPVELLAEDFLARQRRGERPSLADYVSGHPDLADEIQELFPVLLDMEDARGDRDGDGHGESASNHAADSSRPAIRRLGDYRILREVGRGGMGVVYEAEQESLGRRVALKLLASGMSTPQQIRRFECEARSAARLHHTNIVPVFGVGHEGDVHYYVMQFIPGQPLDEVLKEVGRLRRHGRSAGPLPSRPSASGNEERPNAEDVALTLCWGLSPQAASPESRDVDHGKAPTTILSDLARPEAPEVPAEPITHYLSSTTRSDVLSSSTDLTTSGRLYAQAVARIGVQVAEALDYAVEQGVMHRDIKPSNILLDLFGTAWVTDFGLAKVVGLEGITQTGDLVGTLRYMPPERFSGHADHRGDVYALGLTLYEMLALQPAFDDWDRPRLIRRIAEEDPPRLASLDTSIPRDLATIVHKAMAREPADRYATAGALAADLRRFLDDRPIAARRPSLLDRALKLSRRYRSAVIAGAIGVVVALAILAGSLGWIVRDRAARSELTERQVTRALLESTAFQTRSRWLEALEAVKSAEGFLAVGDGDSFAGWCKTAAAMSTWCCVWTRSGSRARSSRLGVNTRCSVGTRPMPEHFASMASMSSRSIPRSRASASGAARSSAS